MDQFNSVACTDPSGKFAFLISMLIGALIGGAIGMIASYW